ncbi:MAG TPA: hypothetical protein VGI91_09120 [Steroidobacteraceae bacterium]|jgi:hypothetical protein
MMRAAALLVVIATVLFCGTSTRASELFRVEELMQACKLPVGAPDNFLCLGYITATEDQLILSGVWGWKIGATPYGICVQSAELRCRAAGVQKLGREASRTLERGRRFGGGSRAAGAVGVSGEMKIPGHRHPGRERKAAVFSGNLGIPAHGRF